MKIAKNKYYKIEKIKQRNGVDVHITIDNNFSLYRYRSINKFTTQQFENDELFATLPTAFNDPYDATVRFSENKIKRHIKEFLLQNNDFLESLLLKNNYKRQEINLLVDCIYQRDLSPNIFFNNSTFALACFSTDVTQEIMWAHYADMATGFAVEYDYSELCSLCQKHQQDVITILKEFNFIDGLNVEDFLIENPLLPIIYDNAKHDVTDFYNEYIKLVLFKIKNGGQYNPLETALEIANNESVKAKQTSTIQNVYFRKKIPWSYENEWRLICYNYNVFIGQLNNNFVNIGKIIPKAIYLGEKISNYDKEALINLAKKKGIKIYIMQTKICRNTLKLVPLEISY